MKRSEVKICVRSLNKDRAAYCVVIGCTALSGDSLLAFSQNKTNISDNVSAYTMLACERAGIIFLTS